MKLCGFQVGLDQPFCLIAGPCVIESKQLALDTAGQLKEICAELNIPFIYKSSFDKANRSSGSSFRGLGMSEGLNILAEVQRQIGVPVLTDVHTVDEIADVAAVVDVLQTPAFLCRQTDFIQAVAMSGKPANIKKGQFLAPWDMKHVVDKANFAVFNITLDGHRFFPGYVYRNAALINGTPGVLTYGEGNGAFGTLNRIAAPRVWAGQDKALMRR